jgi:chondroitin 4-sulfotransferase 11
MYSHEHKFIYVHIPKSAGTFIKHYLLSNIEPEYENNQNQQDYDDKYKVTCERALNAIANEVPDYKDYFKFTIVRNPFDRVVSMYSYLGGWKFDYFVENNIDSPMMPYVQKFHDYYISDDFDGFIDYAYEQQAIKKFHAGYYENYIDRIKVSGLVSIDKFYKLESIEDCLNDLQTKLKFDSNQAFNDWRQNSSSEYKKKKDYKEYYSTYSKDYIEKHFAEDLVYFNYGF